MKSSKPGSPLSPPSLQSHSHDESDYGTPTDTTTIAKTAPDTDPQLVVGAGRSLKNMLVDLMSVLENQAKSRVFIQGDITLRVEGRDAYTIELFNEDDEEPTNLKVRIKNGSPTDTEHDAGLVQKRRIEHVDLTSGDVEPVAKRARTEDATEAAKPDLHASEEQGDVTILSKLNNISAQIKWVEECRRIAGEVHIKKEDKWRTTSATFHDDNRKSRERHEAWMIEEMGWQRNMLIQLASDMKGLYPLTHSLKWETPPHLQALPQPLEKQPMRKPLSQPEQLPRQYTQQFAPISTPSFPPIRKPYKAPAASIETPKT